MRRLIFFNCSSSNLQQTLGVMFYNRQMLLELAQSASIIIIHDKAAADPGLIDSEAWSFISRIVSTREAQFIASGYPGEMVELVAHQFQPRALKVPLIALVFDLHVFDIAWKYHRGDFAGRIAKLCREAQAVITMFPRTYYDLERSVGFTIPNLFLLESPLLVKPKRGELQDSQRDQGDVIRLLYPAQFQLHKNHVGLLRGMASAIRDGLTVRLTLTGSDFAAQKVPMRQVVEDAAQSLGIRQFVDLEGHVSDARLQELYQFCDGLVIPSLAEGGGYVALEGIYAGIPVASNALRSTKLHVAQFEGVVNFFDATNVAATAGAIRWIAECDRSAVFKYNERCRNNIERVGWPDVAETASKVIEFVLGRRSRPLQSISPCLPTIEST